MAHPLTSRHLDSQRRLRDLAGRGADRIWRGLPGYDRENVDEWLSKVLPIVGAAQAQSVVLTDAYLAAYLRRGPLGLNARELVAGLRAGTAPEDVYARPFKTLWTKLGEGTAPDVAFSAALSRAADTAMTDVQLASRAAYGAVQESDDGIYGFQRVANAGACAFCQEVDGAYVKDAGAMPLHGNCGCGLEPLTAPHSRASKLPSGVAVHEHGELGPVLGSPDHNFTGPADL